MNSAGHNAGRPVSFTRSSRKHKIGRAHALHVIATVIPTEVAATDEFDARRVCLGPDHRGVDLEIVALMLPAELLVIHLMPTAYGGSRDQAPGAARRRPDE
jgi:hypothetical protein